MPTADSFVDDDDNFENHIQNSTEINKPNMNYFHQEPIESHSFQTSNPDDFKTDSTDLDSYKVQKFNEEFLNIDLKSSCKEEMNPLHFQVKKLQKLLVEEQDKFTKISKRLHESENQRLELISQNNKEAFELNTKFAKVRNELEKSETLRQNLEYELSVMKCNNTREKNSLSEKEKALEDMKKSFESKTSSISKENSYLKNKIKNLEMELTKEENERLKLKSFRNEQEEVIRVVKEENSLNKECIDKLKQTVEYYKEKEDQNMTTYEESAGRIKCLEEELEKKNTTLREMEANYNSSQQKKKELENAVDSYEAKKSEIELNLEKLMEQLKENRKEVSDEQIKSRELRERFKIIESHLTAENEDLSKKLEDRNAKIKNLAHQLNNHEANFKEIKDELNETKRRQSELDSTFNISMKNIDQIKHLCTFDKGDIEYEQFKSFQRQQIKKSKPPQSVVCPTLTYSVSMLKSNIEDFRKFFKLKTDELHATKARLDKSEHTHLLNSSKVQETENLRLKYEKEMTTLRDERVALEEVIVSLRTECETLRESLNQEFQTSDNLKTQLNKLSKGTKEINDQKLTIFQAIYKRILPLSLSRKKHKNTKLPSDLNDEKNLEEFIDSALVELTDHMRAMEEKVASLEKTCAKKDDNLYGLEKKTNDQLNKLTKMIKEKENYYSNQKDSMVNYYEQLLNDVNSRVKNYIDGYMKNPQWADPKNPDYIQRQEKEERGQPDETRNNLTKSLETECLLLKTNQRALTTSCLILIGMMKPLIQSNNDLKDQKLILNRIFSEWFKTQNQLSYEATNSPVHHANPSLITQRIQNFDLADAVDYSIDSSILTEASENKNLDSNSSDVKATLNHQNSVKIGLFRKVAIIIIAANRLVYFSRQNKNTKLSVQDLKCHVTREFIYSENIETRHSFAEVIQPNIQKSSKSVAKKNDANRINQIKGLFSMSNDNAELLKLNEISTELNRHFFNDQTSDKTKQTSNSVRTITEKLREAIKNCFYVLETNKSNYSPTNDTDSELIIALRKGLEKVCSVNSKIAVHYSFQRKVSAMNSIESKPFVNQIEAIDGKSFAAELNELKHKRTDMIPLIKFESVCNELEESLKREEQAQLILNKQSCQLEDLTKRLANTSDQTEMAKLKNMISEITHKSHKKEKQFKQLQKKLSALQVMKENYENSASSILLDKKLFLNYCQNIENLIQKSLKISLCKKIIDSKEVVDIVRGISSLSFSLNYENNGDVADLKLSPESLACQSIVNLFCIAFNMLIVKMYSRPEVDSFKTEDTKSLDNGDFNKDFSFDSSDKTNTLLSSHYSPENSLILGKEFDISLPSYKNIQKKNHH